MPKKGRRRLFDRRKGALYLVSRKVNPRKTKEIPPEPAASAAYQPPSSPPSQQQQETLPSNSAHDKENSPPTGNFLHDASVLLSPQNVPNETDNSASHLLWKEYIVSPKSGFLREKQDEHHGDNIDNTGQDLSFEMEDSVPLNEGLCSSTPVKTVNLPEVMQCTASTTSSTFAVAEMTCISGLLPTRNVSSVKGTPRLESPGMDVDTFPSKDASTQTANGELRIYSTFLKYVVEDVESRLPASWDAVALGDALIVRKTSCKDRHITQRSIIISRDGTVSLALHCQPIRLDHEIWQQLPERLSLNLGSVTDFGEFVLEVVKVFRSYDVCIGTPEENNADIAKRMPGAKFDHNAYAESRYRCTYRSQGCDLIVPGLNKFCKPCTQFRKALRKRKRRASQLQGSPHPTTKHSCLNTPQLRRKLSKASIKKKNAQRLLKSFREKVGETIKKDGVLIDRSAHSSISKVLQKNFKKLTKVQQIFLEEQLKASNVKGKTGMRWHPLMIRLALQIQMASPAAYDALYGTGIVHLPHARTLFNYSHHTEAKEGISIAAVKDLVQSVKDFPTDSHKRYFMLLMDEMTISQNLVYSRASGELKGFVDLTKVEQEARALDRELTDLRSYLGPGWDKQPGRAALRRQQQTEVDDFGDVVPQMSKKMLSFMAVGITNGIKQVVASYGVDNPRPYQLTTMLWNVVRKLEVNGCHVLGLVCDGHPTNRAVIQNHVPITKLDSKLVFDTWNRAYPHRPFYFISDPPHLLKTIRNCFYNSECGRKTRVLKKDGEFITWRNIIQLYEDEKGNEIRMAHKLNAQVVHLNSYSGMKVSYAARVFSASVANAMETLYPHLKVTVDFIRRVNHFFDCLNGAALLQGKHKRNKYLNPYRSLRDFRFKYLDEFLKYILAWRDNEGKVDERFCLSAQTIVGIEMTVRAFSACVKFMLNLKAPFILARAFCQDPLEQFFGKQRAACGGSTNPNQARFLSTQNKILNIRNLGFRRVRSNVSTAKLATGEGSEARLMQPLMKRKKSVLVQKRVLAIRKKWERTKTPS